MTPTFRRKECPGNRQQCQALKRQDTVLAWGGPAVWYSAFYAHTGMVLGNLTLSLIHCGNLAAGLNLRLGHAYRTCRKCGSVLRSAVVYVVPTQKVGCSALLVGSVPSIGGERMERRRRK